jgi:signal transduction histidine kinase
MAKQNELKKHVELDACQQELEDVRLELQDKIREIEIESALEKVRVKAMAMRTSKDVGIATEVLFGELENLGIKTIRCGIIIGKKEERKIELWTATAIESGNVMQIIGEVDVNIHPLLQGAFEAWEQEKEFFSFKLKGKTKELYYQALSTSLNYTISNRMSSLPDHYCTSFMFQEGGLFAFTFLPFSPDKIAVFKRFAAVFSLTYRRYLDLKLAEAQARESQIQASLERVRSRTLAMQSSNELPETAAVVFKQLINLGIAPNRLYICIIRDRSGDMEFWITDEDGNKVSTQFTGNWKRNASIQKMYDGWKQKLRSQIIDMQGAELDAYFLYLGKELQVPFRYGLSQKRRIQYLAYFSKGFIGMASPEEQSTETITLLERFSAVFNLTFTRFNDLKLAEAQAAQAELDLVKLQTEKKRAEDALAELRSTQAQLIHAEKMASLGELMAGIAHEIQNPLNFVNNFSEVSGELLAEMKAELDKGNADDAKEIASDVMQNLEKINYHGKRAADIVKGMLQHSRNSSGVKELIDINQMALECLQLAFHGLRAKDKSFKAGFITDFDPNLPKINVIPQDIGRVMLNLINNAFYAVDLHKRNLAGSQSLSGLELNYQPHVTVSTKNLGTCIEISVKDNGTGIPLEIKEKIFQPFFTTKPTGEGTGLGLSLSYDIVKVHSGELTVETRAGEGCEFIIKLPVSNP